MHGLRLLFLPLTRIGTIPRREGKACLTLTPGGLESSTVQSSTLEIPTVETSTIWAKCPFYERRPNFTGIFKTLRKSPKYHGDFCKRLRLGLEIARILRYTRYMCKIDNCQKKVQSRELCSTHYMQWYRSQVRDVCSSDDCDRAVYSRSLCESHYKSLLREENPSYDTAQRQALKDNKSLLSPEYKRMHARLRKLRGPARDYDCIDCGQTAAEWSLSADSSLYGIESRKTFPYSQNVEDYAPRCTKCHGIYDK